MEYILSQSSFPCMMFSKLGNVVQGIPENMISVDAARVVVFAKSKSPEKPLTSDALQLHIK